MGYSNCKVVSEIVKIENCVCWNKELEEGAAEDTECISENAEDYVADFMDSEVGGVKRGVIVGYGEVLPDEISGCQP